MRETVPACCARAASGHAATAPPMSVMSSRRLRAGMGSPHPRAAVFTLSLESLGGARWAFSETQADAGHFLLTWI